VDTWSRSRSAGRTSRRRFYEIAKGSNASIASEALERLAGLYAIDKTIRGMSADDRRRVCQETSRLLLISLKSCFEHQLTRVSAKATIADEIRHGLNHWDGITRFVDGGRIELETNIVERGTRPIVFNRKNTPFAGHDHGAENWACIASLIETCKLTGVNPQAYLTDVLMKLVNVWPVARIDDRMPWAWAAEHSARTLAA
jgi:transposase